ncbi:MAG: Flp pilus assembly complex ATPase component TadA [Planctomycetes bacterium]|nr:Flp pilus assembly complex ATPase component TadA [Planctomycetota bacterium]
MEQENVAPKSARGQEFLVEFLLREGLISQEDLRNALEQQRLSGASLARILTDHGRVSEDDLKRAVAAEHGIPFISLTPEQVDPTAAHLVPDSLVRQYRAIPVRIEGDRLMVAMETPLNLAARDEITLLTGYTVVPLAASSKDLAQAILKHFSIQEVTKQEIVDIRLREIKEGRARPKTVVRERPQEGSEGAVIRLVDSIIHGAVAAAASDIHLEPQEPEMRVRYRVDGMLNDIMTIPRHVEPALVSRVKILANLDISERRRPQDGHIAVHLDGRDFDLRVSTLPTVAGEKVVLRVLDKGSTVVDLQRLGLAGDDLQRFQSLFRRPYGMLLITGPTGSGKSTTLYAVLRTLNSGTNNIITIEDPVEYRLAGINQIQVSLADSMTFATGLRTILRQDPNIIMVGEIRDLETAELAVHASLTGHLVFSTLHTNDAAGAVTRLIDLGVEPFLIASCVLGTVAQRLVRSICLDCKETYAATAAEIAEIGAPAGPAATLRLARGRGCPFCYQTGYRGRSGVFEILHVSERVRARIAEKQSSGEIRKTAVEEGMKTIWERGMEKVLAGTTTISEVRRVIGHQES